MTKRKQAEELVKAMERGRFDRMECDACGETCEPNIESIIELLDHCLYSHPVRTGIASITVRTLVGARSLAARLGAAPQTQGEADWRAAENAVQRKREGILR
jgi:hypothetical protein